MMNLQFFGIYSLKVFNYKENAKNEQIEMEDDVTIDITIRSSYNELWKRS